MSIYREELLDHYRNPRNNKKVDNADGMIDLENVSCGDRLKVQLKVKDGVIKEVGYTGEGCAIAIASASLISEYIKDKNLKQLGLLDEKVITDLIGVELTQSRKKCALLGLKAFQRAAKNIK